MFTTDRVNFAVGYSALRTLTCIALLGYLQRVHVVSPPSAVV